jgi:hypothetical protein
MSASLRSAGRVSCEARCPPARQPTRFFEFALFRRRLMCCRDATIYAVPLMDR